MSPAIRERLETAFASIAGSLTKISELTHPMLPPESLPRDCLVRIDGVWPHFDGYDVSTGRMYLDSGAAGWSIIPDEGETFAWVRGGF